MLRAKKYFVKYLIYLLSKPTCSSHGLNKTVKISSRTRV